MAELRVGFIGLGAMGWSMAGHLKRAGLLRCGRQSQRGEG